MILKVNNRLKIRDFWVANSNSNPKDEYKPETK